VLAAAGGLLGTPKGFSPVWKLGWGLRGQTINKIFGDNTFPDNYPVIDKIPNGVATSVKSIDLNAATYQNEISLTNRLNKLVDDVREFNGRDWGGLPIDADDIKGRAVQVIVPTGSMTESNRVVFDKARAQARANTERPVDIIVTEY
jgi:hypothetical protein